MLVRDVMTKDVHKLKPEDYVLDAVKLFKKHHVSGAPVEENGRLVGLLSERDVLQYLEVHEFGKHLVLPAPFDIIEAVLDMQAEVEEVRREFDKLKHAYIKDIMKKEVITIHPDAHVSEAADIMLEKHVNRLPVVESGKVMGIVTRSDILKSLL
ncbi:MAG: CBS domain-containing protein [Candidatus Diapherotrites archaeon]|nr:CBS domain-containing protein [Candidatus Diapherotrites archaeon]